LFLTESRPRGPAQAGTAPLRNPLAHAVDLGGRVRWFGPNTLAQLQIVALSKAALVP
jgi:hypothetical protein